jgi:TolB-like protein/DNA-binding winged helix-turn-helix (wHTH) protein/Tfp pilus assembly protein PilF
MVTKRPFQIGDYGVDPGANRIHSANSSTQIEPKAMAVLCHLAANAGVTINREEIMASVWPGRIVVEETLTRTISQLRAALADEVARPRYIQTVPKQGYRLIAEVREDRPETPASAPVEPETEISDTPDRALIRPSSPGTKIASALVVLVLLGWLAMQFGVVEPEAPLAVGISVLPAKPSVAVMPFRNLGADAESEYFAEGVAEELRNALAAVPGLRVPSRRSSLAFKSGNVDLQTIADQLRVRHILEGSVRRSGDNVRMSAQLIEIGTDTTLWSQQYDRRLQDVFAVQEEIAQQVISALRGTLLGDAGAPPRVVRSSNLDAYTLYLQGQYWWMSGTTSNWFYKARDAFEQAISLDPEFAAAHAGLAYIYARFNFYDEYMPASQARPRALQALETALTLDPLVLDAWFARAILSRGSGDYLTAQSALDRALELNPNSATGHFLYSELWLAENQPAKALAAATRALDLDPLSPWVNVNLAIVQFSIGQWDEAFATLTRAVEIDPEYTWTYVWLAQVEHAHGNLAAAIASMRRCVSIDPASESNASYLGLLYLEVRDIESARRWFEHAASLFGNNSSARLRRQFIALVLENRKPDILLQLLSDLPRLETTTYSLVPFLLAAALETGNETEVITLLFRLHPELDDEVAPRVRIDNASSAVALVTLLQHQGTTARARVLLDAALETAGVYPSLFRWWGLDAQLLALAENNNEAMSALEASFASGWRTNWWMLERNPVLAILRDKPRFRDILAMAESRAGVQRDLVLKVGNKSALTPFEDRSL